MSLLLSLLEKKIWNGASISFNISVSEKYMKINFFS